MVHSLSDQLRSACSNVVSSAQGLPGAVQEQLTNARRSAEDLHSSFGNTSTLTPLLLERSRYHLTQVLIALHSLYLSVLFAASAKLNIVSCLNLYFLFILCRHLTQLVLPLTFHWYLNNTPGKHSNAYCT